MWQSFAVFAVVAVAAGDGGGGGAFFQNSPAGQAGGGQRAPGARSVSDQSEVSAAYRQRFLDEWIPEVSATGSGGSPATAREPGGQAYAAQWASGEGGGEGSGTPLWQVYAQSSPLPVSFGDKDAGETVQETGWRADAPASPPPVLLGGKDFGEAAPRGEVAQERYDRAKGEASLILWDLQGLSGQVSAVTASAEDVRQLMQASLTEEERGTFVSLGRALAEFIEVDRRIREEGPSWSRGKLHDEVLHAESLDKDIAALEERALGAIGKGASSVADATRQRTRSSGEHADELALRAHLQALEMSDNARGSVEERAARDVDGRAQGLARDVHEAGERLQGSADAQARSVDDSARKDFKAAADYRQKRLRQDRAADAGKAAEAAAFTSAPESSARTFAKGLAMAALAAATLPMLVLLLRRRCRAALGQGTADGGDYLLQEPLRAGGADVFMQAA